MSSLLTYFFLLLFFWGKAGGLFCQLFINGIYTDGNVDTVQSAKFHKLSVVIINMKMKDVHFLTDIIYAIGSNANMLESPLKYTPALPHVHPQM